MTKRLNLIQELERERSAALELLERADRRFESLSERGYIDGDDKRLWDDIREFLRDAP